MKFKKITVNCSTETSEYTAYVLHELGSLGEVYNDYNDIKTVLNEKRWDYADETLFAQNKDCSVSGFFTMETDESAVINAVVNLKINTWADFSTISVKSETIDSTEWEDVWKQYYKPFSIGKIVIVPEWIEYKPDNSQICVTLNPGPAFGTGMHETTSMCIDFMQKIDVCGKNVMDFGCGSGILGICALKLNAKSCIFVDNDEMATTAAKHNCMLNGITEPIIYNGDVKNIQQKSDVILANLTVDILISVKDTIKASLISGGYAVLSGIISSRLDELKKAFTEFELVECQSKNNWSAIVYKL